MRSNIHEKRGAGALAAGLALVFLAGMVAPEARAQQALAPRPATPGAGWYGFVPGRGWVGYAPASTPMTSSNAVGSRPTPGSYGGTPSPATAPPPAAGWAGYAPASAWAGYAPASAPISPAVRPAQGRVALPADGSRRRAAGLFVNRDTPGLSYTAPAYREYGTGRPVPLAKPWLPPSP